VESRQIDIKLHWKVRMTHFLEWRVKFDNKMCKYLHIELELHRVV
jgi:hypothetical protein